MSRPIVAFDYDGTLIDAFEAKRESYWRAAAESLGLGDDARAVVDASYARTSGANRFDQFVDTCRALGRDAAEAHRQEFSRLYSHYNAAFKERMREFPSVRHVLGTLRARYDLALLSGLLHDLLLTDVRERGLKSFFDVVEGGDKAGSLERLRAAERSVVLFVGDTSHDEAVAREAGVAFYHVAGDKDLRRLPEALEKLRTSS